jgi:alanyl-tRNA synthetase
MQSQQLSKQGAVASEWASAVAVAVGGKAGGKGPTSIGNGTNVDKIDEGLEIATKFLEKFKI